MAEGDVHTYFEDGLWKNRVEGGTRASNTALRHLDAVLSGRAMARKRRVAHIVHGPDGQIDEERDYRSGRPVSVGRRDAPDPGAPPPSTAELPRFVVTASGEHRCSPAAVAGTVQRHAGNVGDERARP